MSARCVGTGCEILSLAVDTKGRQPCRIACGTRNQHVQVFSVGDQWELQSIFSIQLSGTVPKSVTFSGNSRGDIYVFGLYDGQMLVVSFAWHVLVY